MVLVPVSCGIYDDVNGTPEVLEGKRGLQDCVFLLPRQRDEEVATLHFPALGTALNVSAQGHANYFVVKVKFRTHLLVIL